MFNDEEDKKKKKMRSAEEEQLPEAEKAGGDLPEVEDLEKELPAEENLEGELPVEEDLEKELPETEDLDKELPAEEAPEKPAEPSELEKAQALAEDYKRKWYAVSAEYDNYRKRTAAQASKAYADGKAEAILKLLPVSDTFGYALDSAKDEATKAGIDKIIKNFTAILSSLGVEEVPVKPGDKFDEHVAEAVMTVPCGEGEQPNTVKFVLKKGYTQNGKVIRLAQVSVTV